MSEGLYAGLLFAAGAFAGLAVTGLVLFWRLGWFRMREPRRGGDVTPLITKGRAW